MKRYKCYKCVKQGFCNFEKAYTTAVNTHGVYNCSNGFSADKSDTPTEEKKLEIQARRLGFGLGAFKKFKAGAIDYDELLKVGSIKRQLASLKEI